MGTVLHNLGPQSLQLTQATQITEKADLLSKQIILLEREEGGVGGGIKHLPKRYEGYWEHQYQKNTN